MSQSNLVVADGNGATVRQNINAALSALGAGFYGATDPASYAVALMWWADSGNSLIKQRNAANTAWVPKGILLADGTIQWYASVVKNIPAGNLASTDVQSAINELDTEKLAISGGSMTGALRQPAPASVTISSNTVTLPLTSNRFVVSGTGPVSTITGFSGGEVEIRWNAAVTLTNSASLILMNGGANRITQAGDIGYYGFDSAGVVRETGYTPATPQSVATVPVRQTVLSGAVDSNGLANQLQIGTGLLVNELATSKPVTTTWANGFNSYGAVDFVNVLSNDVIGAWSGLTANSTLYLYKERNSSTGAITYGFTTLPPAYQNFAFASPSTNQYWFDITNYVGQYWSGSAWTAIQRVFVGECVTGASAVTSVISYAYSGKSLVTNPTLPAAATALTKNINIGTNLVSIMVQIICTIADQGYPVGDILYNPLTGNGSGSQFNGLSINSRGNTLTIINNGAWMIANKSSTSGVAAGYCKLGSENPCTKELVNMYCIKSDGSYYEGDLQAGDTEVPQRPSSQYTWDNGAWILSKTQQYATINNIYSAKLDNIITAIQQATARGDSTAVTKLQAVFVAINAEWKTKLKAVQ